MKQLLLLTLLASGLVAPSIRAAQVDFFLKLEGIDGESTDDRHKNTIEVHSFSWGMSQPDAAAGGGGGAGKAAFSDMTFTTKVSKASPKLMLACATGQHMASATLFVHRPGGDTRDYLTIKLEDVLISSYQTGGSGAETHIPTDQLSLNFATIKFDHTAEDGTVTSGEAIRPALE